MCAMNICCKHLQVFCLAKSARVRLGSPQVLPAKLWTLEKSAWGDQDLCGQACKGSVKLITRLPTLREVSGLSAAVWSVQLESQASQAAIMCKVTVKN